ncbi:hypothetical protein CC86DRAFT_413617 [Ophiobolus disseminans]|uniref:BTB domain-containing protein n=1 Tax=Ophiobolus disseminans TaxID=1469910 RepID=A0A6A6ZDE0_9PLEO|nr:hypothetical protein CC86DRAFT_413617 [Ophiobolus disseminans]
MSTNIINHLDSPQFVFHVGPGEGPISVHGEVIASFSQPLDHLVHGMQERTVNLLDIEKEIFLRLVEFGYQGYYTVRLCPGEDENDGDSREITAVAPSQLMESTTGSTLADRWANRKYIAVIPREDIATRRFLVAPHRKFDADHKAIFLLHAKLHHLVKRYEISSLQNLTLQKLHETLRHCQTPEFVRQTARVDDIVALAKYTYDTAEASDELRKEVFEFVMVLLSQVDDQSEHSSLLLSFMTANRDFVYDMMMQPHNRSSNSRTDTATVAQVVTVPAAQSPLTPAQTPAHSVTSGETSVTPDRNLVTPAQTPTTPNAGADSFGVDAWNSNSGPCKPCSQNICTECGGSTFPPKEEMASMRVRRDGKHNPEGSSS